MLLVIMWFDIMFRRYLDFTEGLGIERNLKVSLIIFHFCYLVHSLSFPKFVFHEC